MWTRPQAGARSDVALVASLVIVLGTIVQPLDSFLEMKPNTNTEGQKFPVVLNTWAFQAATEAAWSALERTDDRLEAVQAGCSECESLRCDGTVGFGGSPDETGETTLDALIMDGVSHQAGAVAGLRRVKNAIGVARAVMNYTQHTLLVGDAATQFAIDMGFQQEDLHAIESANKWIAWINASCQPNFRRNVWPDATQSCGPYKPLADIAKVNPDAENTQRTGMTSHDTIGMIAVDSQGNIAAGTSTNGASHKIPGYVLSELLSLYNRLVTFICIILDELVTRQ